VTTLLFEHPAFAGHEVPSGHPERPERVLALGRRLAESPFADLARGPVIAAAPDQILLVHEESYYDQIREAAPKRGLVPLDPDTFLGPHSLDAALHAAGAACSAVDAVFAGAADNAFCSIRPPGHHASQAHAMGFCIFNNAAIAARQAQRRHGAERVAIIDWDVHHGNGTQDIFWSDPSVLYGSTHQWPFYPWTGSVEETGAGNIVNAPLASGAGSDAFRAAYRDRILPAVERFSPDFVVVSAGFDAHRLDPLGGLGLDQSDFAWATERLLELAARCCDGRLISVLEGGYDIDGLTESTAAHVAALMR
jgi:acetoin utilization deacetylase AcuC-like enzyme